MKKTSVCSTIAGILFFALAALFSTSLLLVAVDFGGASPNHETFFYHIGKILTGVYGFCSLCIPAFLIAAGLQCFNPEWRIRNGVVLIGSVLPFFTLDAVEHACRFFAASEVDAARIIKVASALLVGGIILTIEYILLSILGEAIENFVKTKRAKDEPEVPYGFADSDDEENLEDEIIFDDEPEEDFDDDADSEDDFQEDAVVLEENVEENENCAKDDFDESVYEKNDEEDYTETYEPSEKPEAETVVSDEKTVPAHKPAETDESDRSEPAKENDVVEEDGIDFENDPLFLQQKEILKDLINDGKNVEEEKPQVTEQNAGSEEQSQPDEQNADSEKTLSDITFDENDATVDASGYRFENPVNDFDDTVDSSEPEEEQVPINDSDFATAFDDDIENFEPADFISEPNIEEPKVPEEDFDAPPKQPAIFSSVEDIFNQMEADAAIEPVMKQRKNVAEAISHESDPNYYFEEQQQNDEEIPVVVEASEPIDAPETISEDEITFEEPEVRESFGDIEVESDFEEPQITVDFDNAGADETFEEKTVSDETDMNHYEFDPTAKPVLDANGNPYHDDADADDDFDIEEDDEDRSLSEIDGFADTIEMETEEDELSDDENAEQEEEPDFTEPEVVHEETKKPARRHGAYKIPTDLLDSYPNNEYWVIDDDTRKAAESLRQTLNEFGIEAEVTGIRKGPVVTMFEILPASGVKLNKIVSLQDNIALSLAASSVRIVAPIPGKHAVGIEIPNKVRSIVSFKEIIDADLPAFNKMAIPVILGKDISGEPQLLDLAKTPHLLIAGSTGAGKSVCVNSMLLSILYKRSPQQVKLVLIDPKIVELKLYNDIPHLLTPVITEPKRALQSLQYCLCEMERRYALLDGLGARDIISYNKRIEERRIATEKLPYIVVIIDEFADLMATTGKELESTIARLAAMSRAVGIHLVLATQRPSIDVITGLIKANIPSRIAFMVASKMDSRIIIDQVGAEKLLGKGDMLYSGITSPFPTRIQGTLVSDNEVENVVEYVKSYGEPEYIDDEIFVDDEEDDVGGPGLFSDGEDPLYDQALQIVVQAGKASASYIQRRLKIGYNRAARLVEEMEERGIVGPQNGSKPREIIHLP